ncbi:DUF6438 domain-containing protein [Spirosoma pomorum]
MIVQPAHYALLVGTLLLSLLLALSVAPLRHRPDQPNLSGVWIGDSLEALHINDIADSNAQHELANRQGLDLSFSLRTDGDLLYFRSPFSVLRKHAPAGSLTQYTLKISQQSDSSMTLIPLSEEALAFFSNKRSLFFRKQKFSVDTTLHFEKIIFHTTECFGTCSVFHTEIDSAKQLRQHTEILYRHARQDTTGEGYFTGRIPDSIYHELVAAIQTSHLRNLQSDEILCCDAPVITMILYANGTRKSYQSMTPPIVAQHLVHVLYQTAGKNIGKRTKKPFTLEE